jgi:hypothetical protein
LRASPAETGVETKRVNSPALQTFQFGMRSCAVAPKAPCATGPGTNLQHFDAPGLCSILINDWTSLILLDQTMWQPIGNEPYNVGLELAAIDDGVVRWSIQPCRRIVGGWRHCHSLELVDRRPTHWRMSQVPCELSPSPR